MADIKLVAVTGASGFIGAHIVQVCLERGFDVNACVRDRADPKNKFLVDMGSRIGGGKLELFSAELLKQGSYDAAFADVDAVIHAAAVLSISDSQDPVKDMVEPSTAGTLNVLASVDKSGARHYVHTSSSASVFNMEKRGTFTEDDWSDAVVVGGGTTSYNFAKAEGERVVWRTVEGKPYTVSCINPTMVFGRCLAKPHCKASPFIFRQSLYGNEFPNYPMSVVDVRDVAVAHVEAMLRPEADRKRFILDGDDDNSTSNGCVQVAAKLFPQYKFFEASSKSPKALRRQWDNTRSKTILGIKYTPQEEVIRATIESMVESGWVPAKPASNL